MNDDPTEYCLFTTPGAMLTARVVRTSYNPELQLFGNRRGILSLANIFLWLVANAWRREFLSLAELGFVQLEDLLSVTLRLTDAPEASHGTILRLDNQQLLEWSISESGLQQVALWLHDLASKPEHEYDRLLMSDASEYAVHVRMTDAESIIRST